MEFVDKNIYRDRAHQLLKNFLDRCLTKTPYPADLYDELREDVEPDIVLNPNQKTTYKLLLKWILNESHIEGDGLHDGEGYCCYCMRKIKANEIHSTLEHVIPKTIEDLPSYMEYYKVPSSLERRDSIMVLKTIFFDKYHRRALPCPHNIAYENLVASCDGSLPKGTNNHICCNNSRGNHYIPALMFIPEIHDEIKYKQNGFVIWKNNPNLEKRERCRIINEELKLNNGILRIVRMIWCYLSKEGIDCKLEEEDRRRVIDTLRPLCSSLDKVIIQNFLENDNYWDLLEEYRYFNDIAKFTET